MNKSDHQLRVEEFMTKAKQTPLDYPQVPPAEVCYLRARLILEEALETVQALGFQVYPANLQGYINGTRIDTVGDLYFNPVRSANIIEVVDGCADNSVVNTGTLSAFGISDNPVLLEVDKNNLAKFGPGHSFDAFGKLVKPPGHKKPDFAKVLREQGWKG